MVTIKPERSACSATAQGEAQNQLIYAEFLTDLETPVSALLKLQERGIPHILLESVQGGETRARYSIIGLWPDQFWGVQNGVAQRGTLHGTQLKLSPDTIADPFTSLRAFLKECAMEIPAHLPPMAAGIFGYMGYDMVRHMERLPSHKPDAIGIPEALYMRPTVTLIFDSVKDVASIIAPLWHTKGEALDITYAKAKKRIEDAVHALRTPLPHTLTPALHTNSSVQFHSNFTRESYGDAVRKAKEYIVAGDIFQVVPSRRVTTPFPHSPLSFYRALRHLNPSPYLFYLNMGTFSLIGSSPEILVKVKDSAVTIRPIAGTRKRGESPEEDTALEQELLADPKEISEHLMLLDLGRNDVGRVSETGTVKVTEQMIIERYSHVMHIVSNVEGRLRHDKDALDALIAGFPAGTVSGAPKIRAMEIIDELEPERRSFYGGTVGYFSSGGEMDTCIALRTALIKDGILYGQAGGGVVADSDPDAEYMETENKLGAVRAAVARAAQFAE